MNLQQVKVLRTISKIVLVLTGLFLLGYMGYVVYMGVRYKPYKVRVTNVTDSAFTVSWITDSPMPGIVYYGEKDTFLPGPLSWIGKKKAVDDRDSSDAMSECVSKFNKKAVKSKDVNFTVDASGFDCNNVRVWKYGRYYTHHVTVQNLDAEKEYFFRVGDGVISYGKNRGVYKEKEPIGVETFAQKTKNVITDIGSPDPAYGTIYNIYKDEDGFLREKQNFDSMVFLVAETNGSKYEVLSSVVNTDGGWSIDLSNVRDLEGKLVDLKGIDLEFIAQAENFPAYPDGLLKYSNLSLPLHLVGNKEEDWETEEETLSSKIRDLLVKGSFAAPKESSRESKGPKPKRSPSQEPSTTSTPTSTPTQQSSPTKPQEPADRTNKGVCELDRGTIVAGSCRPNDCYYVYKNSVTKEQCELGGKRYELSREDNCRPKNCLNDNNTSRNDNQYCVNGAGKLIPLSNTYKREEGGTGCVLIKESIPTVTHDSFDSETSNTTSSPAAKTKKYQNEICPDETGCICVRKSDDSIYDIATFGNPCPEAPPNVSFLIIKDKNGIPIPSSHYNMHGGYYGVCEFEIEGEIYYQVSSLEIEKKHHGFDSYSVTRQPCVYKDEKGDVVKDSKGYPITGTPNNDLLKTEARAFIYCLDKSKMELKAYSYAVGRNKPDCPGDEFVEVKGNDVLFVDNASERMRCNKGELISDNKALVFPLPSHFDKCATYERDLSSGIGDFYENSDSQINKFVKRVNAESETKTSSMIYFPSSGVYEFVTIGGNTGYTYMSEGENLLIYINRDGKEGYQSPVDIKNPKEDEDLIVDASAVIMSTPEKVTTAKEFFLKQGINIISFNFLPSTGIDQQKMSSTDFLQLVNRSGNNISRISYYAGSQWNGGTSYDFEKRETKGVPFDLVPGKGYVVVAEVDTTISIPGYEIKESVPVAFSSGWNLIGVHGYSTAYTARTLIESINTIEGLKSDNVTWWPTSRGMYQGYQLINGQSYGQDYPISPLNGYFVRVSEFNPKDPSCKTLLWNPGGKHNAQCAK